MSESKEATGRNIYDSILFEPKYFSVGQTFLFSTQHENLPNMRVAFAAPRGFSKHAGKSVGSLKGSAERKSLGKPLQPTLGPCNRLGK